MGDTMATYLERYLAGEHEQVWREIAVLGDVVRDEPALPDAEAVARDEGSCAAQPRTADHTPARAWL
jgi:hypothetical protein